MKVIFALNGNASLIPSSAFTVVPGSSGNIKSAKIYYSTSTIPVGSYNQVTNSGDVFGLGTLNGSYNKGSAYAYVSEFVSYPSINAGNDFTVCANGKMQLSGLIGGGNIAGIWSTNGFGTFNGGFTALTNTYTPSQLDTTIKPVKLFLTATGPCPQLKDTLLLRVKPSPLVNASIDQIVCGNNSTVLLNGSVTGGSSTGIWSSTGTGSFTPNNTTLNASYFPSSADTAIGTVNLILTSTGNGICVLERDTMKVTITKPSMADAGPASVSACANNPTVAINGSIRGSSSTGKWTTSGSGNFSPSNIQLSTGYIASVADVAAGQVKLYLSSTNNGTCIQAKDSILFIFTGSPLANAGIDLNSCKNNPTTVLSGTISGATSTGMWAGGTGTFTPSNTALTVTYTPISAEITAGSVNLSLTSTNNGNCNAVNDNMIITLTAAPSVNAGTDLFACKNNPAAVLSGIISGTTSTGIWSGGTGTFTPNNTALTATYTPSNAEITTGFVNLTLTSTNNSNCNAVNDVVKINYTTSPLVNAGVNLSTCKNNPAAVLSGTVSGATTTGFWAGGAGTFNPSSSVLNATYTPTSAEIAAGSVSLTLSSTNNGNCNQVKDTVAIIFSIAPLANAGIDLNSCKNNPTTVLSGTISGATSTGMWAGGTGTFTPSNTALTVTYTPSSAEITAGSVNLSLTSTNNGNCNAVNDNMIITLTAAPSVNAGADLFACENNPSVALTGVISGITFTGFWAGGTGTFTPSNSDLMATYVPSAAEIIAGFVDLRLTSTNNSNCNSVSDIANVSINASPIVNAGTDLLSCKNNVATALSGTISGVTTTGVWSGGAGTFNPSNSVLNATYTPSSNEISSGFTTLILNSTSNGNCFQVQDTILINYTNAPIANAGIDLSSCKNNPTTVLSGTISGATTTGSWSGGTGTFTPNNSILTATYTPSNSEITAGSVNLSLTSTNNGNCNQISDHILIVFTSPPLVNAGIDLFSCNNNATTFVSGIISGNTSTGIWSGGTGTLTANNSALTATYTPSNTELVTGFVNLVLTSTNNGNCNQVVDSIKINYTNSPIVNAGVDLNSCKNNPGSVLSGLISGATTTGVWAGGTGNFNPSSSVLNATYTPSAAEINAGSVSLILNSTNNGNCNQVRDTVVINFTNSPNANAGIDLYSCKNNAATVLSGTVSGATTTGSWSGGTGTFTPNNTLLTATYIPSSPEINAGFVNLILTSSNNGNCNAVNDLVKLNFVPKPFANFNFNNVCLNSPSSFSDFSLAGIGSLNYWEWNFGNSVTSTLQNVTHTYATSGTFTAQLVVGNSYGCYDTIRKSPTVYPLPSANFGISRVCNGNILNLNFSDSSTVSSPETINQWYWDFSLPGGVQSNLKNPSQLFPGSGLYNINLIVTTNHNCKDTIEKQINLTPRPSAGFAYSISSGINVGTTATFIDTSSYATAWSWSFGDGSSGSTSQNPSTIYYDNGVFIATQIVRDSYGCTDTARVAIKVNNITNEISTLIPNAISPNGDGKNDIWKLEFIGLLYPNTEVEIYNRWGENIFSSNGYTTPWDGTYKGEPLPVGTYYYVINLNDSKVPEPLKGGVLLIR